MSIYKTFFKPQQNSPVNLDLPITRISAERNSPLNHSQIVKINSRNSPKNNSIATQTPIIQKSTVKLGDEIL